MLDIQKVLKNINVDKVAKEGLTFVKNNLPVIFSASAIGCLGLSLYETVKATHKSDMDILAEEERRAVELPLYENTALTPVEKVDLCWRNYIKAALYGGACAFFIIASERKGNEKYLALMSAYELTKKAGEDRRDAEHDIFGDEKVKEIDAVVRQKLADGICEDDIQKTSNDGSRKLFYEPYSNSAFWATDEEILHAFNRMNHLRQKYDIASPNDIVESLDCRASITAADWGWNKDQPLIEPVLSEATMVCGQPAIVIGYSIDPEHNYCMDLNQG